MSELPTISKILFDYKNNIVNGKVALDGDAEDHAKALLERLIAAARLDELKHTESAGYTTVNGDEMGYFTVIDRIAQLTHQANGETK